LDCLTATIKALQSFRVSGSNPQQHSIKSKTTWIFSNTAEKTSN